MKEIPFERPIEGPRVTWNKYKVRRAVKLLGKKEFIRRFSIDIKKRLEEIINMS